MISGCKGVKRVNVSLISSDREVKDELSGFISSLLPLDLISAVLFCLSLLQAIQDIFEKLSQVFLIFPQFNFGNGMMKLARMNIEVQLLIGYGIDAYKNPFSADALGWMLISSFIQGLFFFSLRLLLNKYLMRKVR